MNNIADFDSKEEWYFSLWLYELAKTEMIHHANYHPKSFNLSDKITLSFDLKMASKVKTKDYHLFANHSYSADWSIYWTEKARNILIPGEQPLNKSPKEFPFFVQWSESKKLFFSVIDIKGSFAGPHNNSAVTFPLNQKWVYDKYKIYIQKIVLIPRITNKGKIIPTHTLFTQTFLPRRLLTTDSSGANRKLGFKYILLEEFLQNNRLR